MSSKYRKNIIVQTIVRELDEAGIEPDVEQTSRHVKIRWLINGQPRLYVCSSSPSCVLAHKKARSDVRRMLRTDGIGVDLAEKRG